MADIDTIAQHIAFQTEKLFTSDHPFDNNGKRVLVVSARYDKIGTPIEVLSGLALARRGADVRFLLCDQVMPACDTRRIDRDFPHICDQCWHNGRMLLRATHLPLLQFSHWLNPDDLTEVTAEIDSLSPEAHVTYCQDGVHLGRIAYTSTLRYFLRSTLSTDVHRAKLREFLITATLMLRLTKRVINALSVEAIFISHGIYVTWGVLTEYAATQGIHIVVYGYGYRKGTILLSIGASYHNTLVIENSESWIHTTLSPEQEQRIQNYLSSRANGGMDWISYNTATSRTAHELRQVLALRADRPIYTLFTNVAWDAAVVFHNTAFADMETWLIETIRWAIQHPDIQLVIRCHPVEARTLSPTQQRAADMIQTAFPDLPDHIRVIAADADVNTYDLSLLADLALVYTTKVGLEFATRAIPVVVAGEAFYRGKGFTHDPTTPDAYYDLLESAADKPIAGQVDRAMRYAYYYFFQRYIELPYLRDSGIGQPVLSIDLDDLSQLDPGLNSGMDILCNTLLFGTAPIAHH